MAPQATQAMQQTPTDLFGFPIFKTTRATKSRLLAELLDLCSTIERREDYPESRVRVPGIDMVFRWFDADKNNEDDWEEIWDNLDLIRRWARGEEPLPERRVGLLRETTYPLPKGVYVS